MRARRLASSSPADHSAISTIHDAPSSRGSNASNASNCSNSSSSTVNSYDSFLIPDTSSDSDPSHIPTLDRNSRRSTWDKYLLDAAKQRQQYERDRLLLRKEVLHDMKRYYGHKQWKKVSATEDVELYHPKRVVRFYLNTVVLYGEFPRKRSRYVDRQNHEIDKRGFKRRPLNPDEHKAGFFARVRERLVDDFRAIGI